MKKNLYNVPIAELLSLSPLRNKSFTRLRVLPMSLNGAPNAAKRGNQNVAVPVVVTVVVTVVVAVPVKCSPWYVPSVAKTPKYPLSHAATNLFTAAIVSRKRTHVINNRVKLY